MRNEILAMTLALTLASGHLSAETHKAPPADVGPGRIAWFDLTTTHLSKSKQFYGQLLAWKSTPRAGTDQAVEIVAGGTAIGTLRGAEGKISPFNGVVYVQVSDLAGACKKVGQVGGSVVAGFPFNLPDGIAAIALVVDPSGHPLGLYS